MALRSCAGFRVDSAKGYRGVVENVVFGSSIERPEYLVVRGGLLRRRRKHLPVGNVVSIDPRRRRLLVIEPDPRASGERCDP